MSYTALGFISMCFNFVICNIIFIILFKIEREYLGERGAVRPLNLTTLWVEGQLFENKLSHDSGEQQLVGKQVAFI